MREKLLKLIEQKEQRRAALKAQADASQEVAELRSINTELSAIVSDIAELRGMLDAMGTEGGPNGAGSDDDTTPQTRATASSDGDEGWQHNDLSVEPEQRSVGLDGATVLGTYGMGQGQQSEHRQQDMTATYEQRGKDLKDKRAVTFGLEEIPELRSITIGSSNLVVEDKYSREVNRTFGEVSRVIDVVHSVPLMGGESYTKAFEVSNGEGDYTVEGGDYNETDPVYDYVSIGKAKVTAYTELTEEVKKLPNINYQEMVRGSITKAIRKKVSKQILAGAGGANAITGIFNAPAKVIPAASDLELSVIDENTLDEIVISYGGDEEVEGMGYLVLNKKDLAAFARVRGSDGKKLYKIKTNGNVGTISSEDSFEVPFIINSVCPALSATGTAVDTYCMAYGMMQAYEMPIFSALTVEESSDYKFKSGQIAFRGSIYLGGNTAMYKGFIRIKKVAAV